MKKVEVMMDRDDREKFCECPFCNYNDCTTLSESVDLRVMERCTTLQEELDRAGFLPGEELAIVRLSDLMELTALVREVAAKVAENVKDHQKALAAVQSARFALNATFGSSS